MFLQKRCYFKTKQQVNIALKNPFDSLIGTFIHNSKANDQSTIHSHTVSEWNGSAPATPLTSITCQINALNGKPFETNVTKGSELVPTFGNTSPFRQITDGKTSRNHSSNHTFMP